MVWSSRLRDSTMFTAQIVLGTTLWGRLPLLRAVQTTRWGLCRACVDCLRMHHPLAFSGRMYEQWWFPTEINLQNQKIQVWEAQICQAETEHCQCWLCRYSSRSAFRIFVQRSCVCRKDQIRAKRFKKADGRLYCCDFATSLQSSWAEDFLSGHEPATC